MLFFHAEFIIAECLSWSKLIANGLFSHSKKFINHLSFKIRSLREKKYLNILVEQVMIYIFFYSYSQHKDEEVLKMMLSVLFFQFHRLTKSYFQCCWCGSILYTWPVLDQTKVNFIKLHQTKLTAKRNFVCLPNNTYSINWSENFSNFLN